MDQDCSGESLQDFLAFYLDGDKSINGIVWNRVQPREDNLSTILPKSLGKVAIEDEHATMLPRKVKREESRHA